MKKQLVLSFLVFGIAACTANPYSSDETLADMFIWGQRTDKTSVHPVSVPAEQVAAVKTVEVPAGQNTGAKPVQVQDSQIAKVEHIKQQTLETDVVEGYRLAKRGDRYAGADYIITPQVYGIVASRTANKMLTEAPAIFAKNKNAALYIADTVQIDRYLPDGPDVGGKAAKEILYGSKMFNIVNERDEADYILESSVNNVNTPEVPVIVYEMKLYDASGQLAGSWSDSIRQVLNDDGSWW